MKFQYALALALACLATACGTAQEAALTQDAPAVQGDKKIVSQAQPVTDTDGILSVADEKGLPECDAKTEGKIVYLKSLKAFRECHSTVWDVVELTGVNGRDGKDGKDGQSVVGASGKDGHDGKDGINGKDGQDGAQGLAGANGAQGAQGLQGVAGSNGAQGSQGAQGYAGVNAPTVVSSKLFEVGTQGLSWQFTGKFYGSSVLVDLLSDGTHCISGSGLAPRSSSTNDLVTFQMTRVCGGDSVKGMIAYKGHTDPAQVQGLRFAFVSNALQVFSFQGTTNTATTPYEILDRSTLL